MDLIPPVLKKYFGSKKPKKKKKEDDNTPDATINLPFQPDPPTWGTFRSNLYFGLRRSAADSLLLGLMWYDSQATIGSSKICPQIRHECSNFDGLTKWGWVQHNGRGYGKEIIEDPACNARLDITFVRVGNDWRARIQCIPLDSKEPIHLKLCIYALKASDSYSGELIDDSCRFKAGEDLIQIFHSHGSCPDDGAIAIASLTSLHIEPELFWKIKEIYTECLTNVLTIDEETDKVDIKPNAFIYELGISSPTNLTILHLSDDNKNIDWDKAEDEKSAIFDKKVEKLTNGNITYRNLAESAIAGLCGGLIYLRGRGYKFSYEGPQRLIVETDEYELFTDTPSRTRFPRGFLWDTGLHNLLLSEWDQDLAMDVLWSWISLIDNQGWLAREQMPGPESRRHVPMALRIQHPEFGNPPTIFLAMQKHLEQAMENNNQRAAAFIRACYPALKRHFEWYLRTQAGTNAQIIAQGGDLFRWRGRSAHHLLTSGLDDYPRGEEPSEDELHLDLSTWLVVAGRILSDLGMFMKDWETHFSAWERAQRIWQSVEEFHWNPERKCYQDLTTDGKFVDHIGYVSVLPLILGLVDDPDRRQQLAQVMKEHLLTPFGMRSLGSQDTYYWKGDQYWTGPVWINLNVLFCLYNADLEISNLRELIKERVLQNMAKELERTGFIWEQYCDRTGTGLRGHPFTGWSSLVVFLLLLDDK